MPDTKPILSPAPAGEGLAGAPGAPDITEPAATGPAPTEPVQTDPAPAKAGPFGGRSLLWQMLAIAAPSVVTMTSYSAMQFMDRLMVKEIGPEPKYVAAQGTAGIATWTLMTFCVGLTGVVSSFVSQNLGAGKPERGAAYAWNSMWIGLAYWAALMLPAALFTPQIMGIFDHAPEVRQLEEQYAAIAFSGALFTLMAKGLHNYFFGLHKPSVVALAVVTGNLTNVFFNAVLIFGPAGIVLGPAEGGWHAPLWNGALLVLGPVAQAAAWLAGSLGIPAMGLAGAALATVIGTVVEWGIPMLVFVSGRHHRAYRSRASWRPSRVCLRDIARIGWPAGLMFVNELVLWAYMMGYLTPKAAARAVEVSGGTQEAITSASTLATTTGFIALQWMHLSFMPAVGISIATQAMVGKAIGARRIDTASATAWLGLGVTLAYMGACAVVFVLYGRELISVFINTQTPPEQAEQIIGLGIQIMIAAAVFQLFDAMAITMSAALRGAGDTVWPGVATIVSSWTCIFGLGWALLLLAPGLGGVGPWIGAAAYIIALGVLLTGRFLGGKWKTMRLVHDDPLHNLPPDAMAPGTSPGA